MNKKNKKIKTEIIYVPILFEITVWFKKLKLQEDENEYNEDKKEEPKFLQEERQKNDLLYAKYLIKKMELVKQLIV